MTPQIQAAPINSYPTADKKFFAFWYGHMKGDLMQPPLAEISHATARYVWDAAIAALEAPQALDERAMFEAAWIARQRAADFGALLADSDFCQRNPDGTYKSLSLDPAWWAWQTRALLAAQPEQRSDSAKWVLTDEVLADCIPQTATILETAEERSKVCMTRADLHVFARSIIAAQPEQAKPSGDRWADGPVMPPELEGRMTVWLTNGKALHPLTQSLVVRFARALAAKLAPEQDCWDTDPVAPTHFQLLPPAPKEA